MALTLLRHTTPDVDPGLCYGRTDLPLADSFGAEAAAVLEQLPVPACVISSPLSRCLHLARRIAAEASLELRVETSWIEMDFGRWEGVLWDVIPRAELDAWAADFMAYRGHGGESVADLAARVATGLGNAPEGALVVTHAGCIKAALAQTGAVDGWNARTPFGGLVALQGGL